MGGMKPCMMGGPRMMPGANINAMNGKHFYYFKYDNIEFVFNHCFNFAGGIMMDGGMNECGNSGGPNDHPMGLSGPLCEDFVRGRNVS